MAAITPDLGHGASLSFGASPDFFANLTGLDWSGISREAVDTTTFSTSGGKTFIPSDTYDGGEISVTMHLDTDVAPPITASSSQLTITFADGETWSANAFMTSYEFSARDEEVMEASATFKVDGSITF